MSIIDCPSCGKKWDTQLHYACECGAWFSKNEPRNLAKPNAQPPLSDSFPDNETIEFVAEDESTGIDWNDLAFRPVWVEGFIAGAKWTRSVKSR